MSIFDKLTARQLLVFSAIMAETTLMQIEFIRERYLPSALNFDETVDFLRELGLIGVHDGEISLKSEYKTFLISMGVSRKNEQTLKRLIGRLIVERKTPAFDEVKRFASFFELRNHQYQFKPNGAAQRLAFSGARNFLMELEVVHLDPGTTTYVMNDDYYEFITERLEKRSLTPEELVETERRNREIGLRAELRIIEYEKDRLAAFPGLVENIEHVAKYDISFGYDIKSFEGTGKEPESTRLIEVKAVSKWDFAFNLTRNEIETSRTNGERYYLYLLPVITRGEFDLESIKIIKDPYTNVLGSERWSKSCESLSLKMMATQ